MVNFAEDTQYFSCYIDTEGTSAFQRIKNGGITMQLTIREPGSAITHFIACLMTAIAASPQCFYQHSDKRYTPNQRKQRIAYIAAKHD